MPSWDERLRGDSAIADMRREDERRAMNQQQKAQLIWKSARDHKRASAYHRKMARARMEELRAFCETAGIKIINPKDIGEIQSHDESETAPRAHH